jgi:LacI family transcriptional regulator
VASGVSALIIMAGFHTEDVDYADLSDIEVPIVMISLRDDRSLLPTVCYDHRDAGHLAAKHLLNQGCSQIVFFSPNTQQWALDRRTGAREAMIVARRSPEDLREWFVDAAPVGSHDREDGLKIAADWLDRHVPFDGIIAANDDTAFEFMEVAASRGLIAGRDYASVGFDDTPQARFAGVTSVKPPIDDMGREAVSLVDGLLRGKPMSKRVTLHSKLVARESTALYRR